MSERYLSPCGAIDLRLGRWAAVADRFWSHVARHGDDECWEWTGCRTRRGYGNFRVGSMIDGSRKMVMAHRVALSLATGADIDHVMVVMHGCDNPPCVNPSHLRIGTAAENIRDAITKGRWIPHTKVRAAPPVRRGAANGNSRLSDDDIVRIRRAVAAGESQASVARAHGVSGTHVGRIIHGVSR